MSEGFDPADAPVTRGRRDPAIAAALLNDDEQFADVQDGTDQTYYGLAPGDTVMAKTTAAGTSQLGDVWHVYGAQTHVQPGESEEDAFARVCEVTNTRVLDLAEDFIARLEDRLEAQREEARHNRIPTRRT